MRGVNSRDLLNFARRRDRCLFATLGGTNGGLGSHPPQGKKLNIFLEFGPRVLIGARDLKRPLTTPTRDVPPLRLEAFSLETYPSSAAYLRK
jgi:hypothetical protein